MEISEERKREALDHAIDWKAANFIEERGLIAPGATPFEHLEHTLHAYAEQPDDHMQIVATGNLFKSDQPNNHTGLTWGDLRSLHAEIVTLREENAAYAAAQSEQAFV